MMSLLEFREMVKCFYQKHNLYLTPIAKFIFAFISFTSINIEIGYDTRLESIPVVLGVSLLCAFTPSAVMVLLAALIAALHIYSVAPVLSIIVVVIFLILYLLFVRYTPRLGYVILAIPVLYFLKIPYLIPLLLGIISTPLGVIPIACGVVVHYVIQVIQTALTMQSNSSIDDILQVYTYIIDNLTGNKQMIMTIVIFALILLVVYYVRKLKFDYAFEIAIAAGALTGILGFLISDLIFDKSDQIIVMILGMIGSAVLVYIFNFFKLTLDYSGAEYVQFEDDVYYYYVKAVPKITVTTPQMKVKHINMKSAVNREKTGLYKRESDSMDEYDEDEDD